MASRREAVLYAGHATFPVAACPIATYSLFDVTNCRIGTNPMRDTVITKIKS